jgi:hypothetical protein
MAALFTHVCCCCRKARKLRGNQEESCSCAFELSQQDSLKNRCLKCSTYQASLQQWTGAFLETPVLTKCLPWHVHRRGLNTVVEFSSLTHGHAYSGLGMARNEV